METETVTVTDLITALEKATSMAKHLPPTTTTTTATTVAGAANIYASLHTAHRHLSLFLASSPPSDLNLINGHDSPMQFADEEEHIGEKEKEKEEDSKMETIESVEEQMKDCFIQKNKRLKRSLSPESMAAAGDRRQRWLLEDEIESARVRNRDDCDPDVMKLRAIDLIYQFHC